MIWAKEETLPRAEIEKIQLERLQKTAAYIYERVEPYRKKMDEAGVKPEDIQSREDLKKMPFTYKADFRDHYPDGLFAVDKKEIVRYHASSGTTGKPTVVAYTKNDLDVWLNNVARIACMGGATSEDVAQIAFGYHGFTLDTVRLPEHLGCMEVWRSWVRPLFQCLQAIRISRLCLCRIWV